MEKIKIALTQMDIVWEDKEQNKRKCEELVKQAAGHQADLIIFPEMTLTGFTMQPELFAEMPETSETEVFFRDLSITYDIGILYGYIAEKNGAFYNQMKLLDGQETIFEYAKIHPFSFGEEALHYAKGEEITGGIFRGMAVGGFICYDLRFPEVFQISSKKNTVLFVIASWPKSRLDHWFTLLKARAIENQCFLAGVNRTGNGGGLEYAESSVLFGPYGEQITENSGEELLYGWLDTEEAEQYRMEFGVKNDRREDFYCNKML